MMKSKKLIIVDANIMIRAVLGKHVPDLMERYRKDVLFYTSAHCFIEVEEHLPSLLVKRYSDIDITPEELSSILKRLHTTIYPFDEEF